MRCSSRLSILFSWLVFSNIGNFMQVIVSLITLRSQHSGFCPHTVLMGNAYFFHYRHPGQDRALH